MPTQINTMPARIVWGNPLKPVEALDMQTRQPRMRDGQKVIQYKCGLAIPKNEFTPIFQAIMGEVQKLYPQAVWSPTAQSGGQSHTGVPKDFSFKFIDGDGYGVDDKGQQFHYGQREGHAGCYVLTLSTEIPVLGYKNVNGAYMQWTDIKTGDYVVVPLTINAHEPKGASKGGVYINPALVEFIGYGQPIVNGPDAQQLLGGRTYQLPPGASATPMQPAGPGAQVPGAMPGQMMPGQPMQQMQPAPVQQAPQYAPQPQQQPAPGQMTQPVQPAYDFVQPGMHPQQQQPIPGQQQAPGMMPGFPNGQAPGQSIAPGQVPVPMATGYAAPTQPGYVAQPGMPATGYPSSQPGQFPNGGVMPGMR